MVRRRKHVYDSQMEIGNSKMLARMRGEVLTPREACEVVRISYPTMMRRLKDGTIPGKKIGSVYRISRKALEAYLGIPESTDKPSK
ncbi:helix-turn-helix domain-containing protein [Granulicella sp. L60]|uniref:helix-turn-helix domain-containing protein n=1 Tax=Granulicella sp. L60 TaxID=1641866 RepID=UPI00352B4008